jgi:mono/diheme cytochrome c family protein
MRLSRPLPLLLLIVLMICTGCTPLDQAAAERGPATWGDGAIPLPLPDSARMADRLAVGMVELRTVPDAEISDAQLIQVGEFLYATRCAACHHPNGEGNIRYFPALNHNGLVVAQVPTPLIEIVLYGRGAMPAFHNGLTAQEIAAVLSYIRNAWDNQAAVVRAPQIVEAQQFR